jgi:hypothetical protein
MNILTIDAQGGGTDRQLVAANGAPDRVCGGRGGAGWITS